jgi:hypothetical protein
VSAHSASGAKRSKASPVNQSRASLVISSSIRPIQSSIRRTSSTSGARIGSRSSFFFRFPADAFGPEQGEDELYGIAVGEADDLLREAARVSESKR